MKLGIVGLGKMGNAIAQRVINGGYEVVGFDVDQESLKKFEKIGAETATDLSDLAERADVIWIMVPAGKPVDLVIKKLLPHLQDGNILIDGGNSNFKDSQRRALELKKHGIYFIDCGTSGGLRGREIGFCLMVGGDEDVYLRILPILEVIGAKGGVGYMGASGAGHYVKMIHNAIEYGLLQAYSEGLHLLKEGACENLDLEKITKIWLHGSIIRSFILELAHEIYEEKKDFSKISGEIGGGETGRWAVQEAKEQGVPLRVIEESLNIRKLSGQTGGNYATKLVAILRNKFGGHSINPSSLKFRRTRKKNL